MNRIILLFCFVFCSTVYSLPDSNDIDKVYQNSHNIYSDYKSKTFNIRLGYHLFNGFSDNGKIGLLWQLSKECADSLNKNLKKQQAYLEQIENYPNNDWDTKFTNTGLWQKLRNNIVNTRALILDCLADYSFALDKAKSEQLKLSITSDNLWEQGFGQTVEGEFLKIKIDPDFANTDNLYRVYKSKSNLEIKVVCAAIYYNRFGRELLKKLIFDTPILENNLSEIFYDYAIQDMNNLNWISSLESNLICSNLLNKSNQTAVKLIKNMAEIRDIQSYILFKTACELSKKNAPISALNYYLKASKSPNINEQDFELLSNWAKSCSFQLWQKGEIECSVSKEVFDTADSLNDEPTDNIDDYYYAIINCSCGDIDEAKRNLEQIAKSESHYSIYARYQLIAIEKNPDTVIDYQQQLEELIADAKELNLKEITENSIIILSRILLAPQDKPNAEIFLSFANEQTDNWQILLAKSKAYLYCDQPQKALDFLVESIINGCKKCDFESFLVMDNITQNIERLLDNSNNSSDFLDDCFTVIDFNLNNSEPEYKVYFNLFNIEFIAITQNSNFKPSPEILDFDENSIEALRALARFNYWQKDYNKAGNYWANICQVSKQQNPAKYASTNQWQQAKYNEILSMSKLDGMKDKLERLISILIKTNGKQMDKYWVEKIKSIQF